MVNVFYEYVFYCPLPQNSKDFEYNYGYYPVIFNNEAELLRVMKALNDENIYSRCYFYPSLNTLPYLQQSQRCPISEDIARRILCLPLYGGLEISVIEKISNIIKGGCIV
jgi:dTDP-4-amino-4,6-dideoxygalactose transaminase